ncbi:S-phase kinase-associated protein 2-like [Daphnia pulex]|uniref:S-phase kinase-associated protein 2-like n=1 Tax=Daphnia pulex TaxID=6669 RepID=UPI001EE01958|nr:S-phase kinase-associated protein 2-like [Daphnia pulex]
MAKLNTGFKRWSLDCHDVSIEVMEDLGLSAMDDDSNSCSNPSVKQVVISNIPEPAVKRKECSPFAVPSAVMDFSEDDQSSDSFLLSKRMRMDGPPGIDGFSRLSDEVILSIFKWLPKSTIAKCAQVSKRWKRLCYDEVLWRRLDLSGTCLKPTILGSVLLRGAHILRLAKTEICDPIYPVSPLLQEFPRYRNLQFLDLSMASISTQGLFDLFDTCKNLKKLSMEHCVVDERACKALSQNEQLEVLNMSMCYGVGVSELKWIVNGCKKLDSWNLAWTDLNSEALQLISTSAPKSLERINISGCRTTLKDEHVLALCQRCPKLVELDISDSTAVTSICVSYIHDNLKRLEYLAMARCYNVPLSVYLVFQKSGLLYLDIFGLLTETMLGTLRAKLPSIEINKFYFSSVARPTVGIRRTSIWGMKVRE